MNNTNEAKPVTIITGFLGAGKTTFLNALIQYHQQQLAVIENELGEESIDGELIVGVDDNLFELSNGCLCCTLNEDFFEILEVLWTKKDSFDELVIETTGIADPASVARPFMTNRGMQRYYQLKRVICLVDADSVEHQLATTEEARKQISFSDILLITKTDLVTPAQLSNIESLLKKINPFATVLSGNKDAYPLAEIYGLERHTIPNDDHHHHHHHDLVSLSFVFDEPFDLPVLSQQLDAFLNFQAKDVYRVKGIINAQYQQRQIILQSLGKDLSIEPGKLWEDKNGRKSRIVFIGKMLNPTGFEKMLRKCLAKSLI